LGLRRIDLFYDEYGVRTWTTNAASPFTGLNHWIRVVDYEGIADDGSSHTVTVAYPNGGSTKNMRFYSRIDANPHITNS